MSTQPTKLVIVPGHASFKEQVSVPLPSDIQNDEYWVLQDFQKGEPPFYIEHIQKGLEFADADSLLVFPGDIRELNQAKPGAKQKLTPRLQKPFHPQRLALRSRNTPGTHSKTLNSAFVNSRPSQAPSH